MTEGGGAGCWEGRPSRPMVAERVVVEDEVAVPGLSLDIVGDPLVEAADECGASGENVSMVGNQMEKIE